MKQTGFFFGEYSFRGLLLGIKTNVFLIYIIFIYKIQKKRKTPQTQISQYFASTFSFKNALNLCDLAFFHGESKGIAINILHSEAQITVSKLGIEKTCDFPYQYMVLKLNK